MAKTDVWPMIHAERKALAADLEGLGETQWATRSLCADWTVHDVLAHMVATAKTTPPAFLGRMIKSGFSFNKVQAQGIAAERGSSPGDTLAQFKAEVDSTNHPPGPTDTWLGEAVVHAEDIRRPLGITRQYPTDATVRAADFYKGSNILIGSKKRIAGLRLRATDVDWSHGDGPEVSGPMISLVMAMTGRRVADLSGDGVAELLSRQNA